MRRLIIIWIYAVCKCLLLSHVAVKELIDHVQHLDYLLREEGACCFAFLWFVACVLVAMVYMLSFGDIYRLCSVIVTLSGHLLGFCSTQHVHLSYLIGTFDTAFKTICFAYYSAPSLQRQHLFPKTVQIKWICYCTEYLMSRLCKKGLVLSLFPHRTYVIDMC